MFRPHGYHYFQRIVIDSKRSSSSSAKKKIIPVVGILAVAISEFQSSNNDDDTERDEESPLASFALSRSSLLGFDNDLRYYTTNCDAAPSSYYSKLFGSQQQQQQEKSSSAPSSTPEERMQASVEKGQTLKSRYAVDWSFPLGEGGFGAVYRATDKKTKEAVALKKISKRFTQNKDFQREMDAFFRIRDSGGHPNICGLHDYFDEGKFYYLTLDLVSGGEMFDHLVASGPYSEADAARLMREVASAMAFLHGIGIVHGDLKPENLMLSTEQTSDAVVKVIDFGTAKVLDLHANMPPGGQTVAYSPPEALMSTRRDTINPSFDMWSLGIVLYIMLVGAHPFDLEGNASDEDLRERVVGNRPLPLKNFPYASHLSDSAVDLIQKLLAHKESDRMTAHELLNHPWIQGITANTTKIRDSDTKLSKFRKIKSRLEAKVFADLISWSDEKENDTTTSNKMSLIERAFRSFDSERKGFVTAKDLGNSLSNEDVESDGDEDEALSLSAFSDLLSDRMKNEYYKKGDVIYREGDTGDNMVFINSGVVEVTNKAGFRTTLKRGDFAGEGALISDRPRSGTVKCITPVHAIKITKEYFDKYLSTSDSGLNLRMLEKDKDRETSRIVFSSFSNLLSKNMKNESYQEGDIVYNEGEEGSDMFFISSGIVEVSNKDGFRTTLQQGDFVGEGALLSNKPRSGTVTCLTPVQGMKITKDYFDKYLKTSDSRLSLTMHETNKDRSLSRAKMILQSQKSRNNLAFSRGKYLFHQGDSSENLFLIEKGLVDVDVGGHTVYRLHAGDMCGLYSAVLQRPRNASAKCSSKICNIVEIPQASFHDLLEESSSSMKESLKDFCLRQEFQKAIVFQTRKEFPTTPKPLRQIFVSITGGVRYAMTIDTMAPVLRKMNPNISDDEIRGVFGSLDIEGKGSVDFRTFQHIFCPPNRRPS